MLNDVVYLVGWGGSDPWISFSFGGTQTVGSVADSDGSAGVSVPGSIKVRTADSSFSRTFVVTDPLGNGTMVPITFSGFSVSTDELVLGATSSTFWTMFSKVRFDSVSEPSPGVLIELGWGVVFARCRRSSGSRTRSYFVKKNRPGTKIMMGRRFKS